MENRNGADGPSFNLPLLQGCLAFFEGLSFLPLRHENFQRPLVNIYRTTFRTLATKLKRGVSKADMRTPESLVRLNCDVPG
jgi:hypothetical protein